MIGSTEVDAILRARRGALSPTEAIERLSWVVWSTRNGWPALVWPLIVTEQYGIHVGGQDGVIAWVESTSGRQTVDVCFNATGERRGNLIVTCNRNEVEIRSVMRQEARTMGFTGPALEAPMVAGVWP